MFDFDDMHTLDFDLFIENYESREIYPPCESSDTQSSRPISNPPTRERRQWTIEEVQAIIDDVKDPRGDWSQLK